MKSGCHKATTPKQLEANRRNAQRSTGPRTMAGKAVSRMNALKHGLLSREVLVQGAQYKESLREFRAYRERCWEELAPVGPLEEALVDELVVNRWRRRRILLAESGEIALSVERVEWRDASADIKHRWIHWINAWDMLMEMQSSMSGLHYLKQILVELRENFRGAGRLTEDACKQFLGAFANKPNELTKAMDNCRRRLQDNPDKLVPEALLREHREQVLDIIEKKEKSLYWPLQIATGHEKRETMARQNASVLPSADTLDKILRYETALDRQFYRAMNQLERLQRIRGGEQVPAPVTMEISARG